MSKKIIHLSQSVLTFLPTAIGKFAAWFVVAMIFLTGIVVFCRYVLNIGIISLQEMTIYLHGSLFIVCSLRTGKTNTFESIFLSELEQPRKALINFLGQVLFVQPMAWLTLLISIDYVSFSWSIGEVSPEPGGLPIVYVLKSMLLVFAILLILQSAAMILKYFEDR